MDTFARFTGMFASNRAGTLYVSLTSLNFRKLASKSQASFVQEHRTEMLVGLAQILNGITIGINSGNINPTRRGMCIGQRYRCYNIPV